MNSTAASPPPSSSTTATAFQGDTSNAGLSLLSLSMAAASATPIPLSSNEAQQQSVSSSVDSFGTSPGLNNSHTSSSALSASGPSNGVMKHHRRLSSTGKARRRLSDARDAAARPSPSAAAALSMATLSLSSSPTPHEFSPPSKGSVPISTPFDPLHAPNALGGNTGLSASPATSGIPIAVGGGVQDPTSGSAPTNGVSGAKPISITGKNGKKRGMDHKCESCSKIYRHPSCLIKHRWEHTPHWRESSKYVLSKHQQVQLLEAAAILSHFSSDSATGTSLPEDRSLWPSFLSGGTLPLPDGANPNIGTSSSYTANTSLSGGLSTSYVPTHPSSSSVPAPSVLRSTSAPGSGGNSSSVTPARVPSTGPRLHDYTIPSADVTQVRPGLLMMGGSRFESGAAGSAASSAPTGEGVIPVGSSSTPISVPPHEGLGIGYGHRASSSFGASSTSYYRSGSGTSGSVPSSSSYTSSTRTKLRSKSSASQGAGPYGYGGGGHGNGAGYAPPVSISTSASSYTSTSLSLPRSSLRSGSAFSESERSRSSSLEGEDDDEGEGGEHEHEHLDGDGDKGRYNDHEFDDDEEDGSGGVDRDGDIDISNPRSMAAAAGRYAFGGRSKSIGRGALSSNGGKNFDEYGYEYDRGVFAGANGHDAHGVHTHTRNGLNVMKEEEEDWEMEMDMD